MILVGLGGGMGSIFRYLTSMFINRYFPGIFPFATLGVNLLGCFALGLLTGIFARQGWSQGLHFLFVVGFCGGYTTFSTFAIENISLLQSSQPLLAIAYIGASVVVGLLAVWSGFYLMK